MVRCRIRRNYDRDWGNSTNRLSDRSATGTRLPCATPTLIDGSPELGCDREPARGFGRPASALERRTAAGFGRPPRVRKRHLDPVPGRDPGANFRLLTRPWHGWPAADSDRSQGSGGGTWKGCQSGRPGAVFGGGNGPGADASHLIWVSETATRGDWWRGARTGNRGGQFSGQQFSARPSSSQNRPGSWISHIVGGMGVSDGVSDRETTLGS